MIVVAQPRIFAAATEVLPVHFWRRIGVGAQDLLLSIIELRIDDASVDNHPAPQKKNELLDRQARWQ